jgi:hypothetical protein
MANFAPIQVLVTDPTNKPATGVSVVFTCSPATFGTCQFGSMAATNVTAVTDGQGHASALGLVTSLRPETGPGTGTVTIQSMNANAVTSMTALPAVVPTTVVANAKLAVVSGNNQTQAAGQLITFSALSVLLTTANGVPLANYTVTFNCIAAGMNCVISANSAQATALTDSTGVATLNVRGGNSATLQTNGAGPFTITATYGTQTVTFAETIKAQ